MISFICCKCWRNLTGVTIGAPTITSYNRLKEDPSQALIMWSLSANVVDISIYIGDTSDPVSFLAVLHTINNFLMIIILCSPPQNNLNRTVDISTARNSVTINRLGICTPYWLVLRSATCASDASSEPVKLDIEDYKPFDLTFD